MTDTIIPPNIHSIPHSIIHGIPLKTAHNHEKQNAPQLNFNNFNGRSDITSLE